MTNVNKVLMKCLGKNKEIKQRQFEGCFVPDYVDSRGNPKTKCIECGTKIKGSECPKCGMIYP